jgi:hypothetical protein
LPDGLFNLLHDWRIQIAQSLVGERRLIPHHHFNLRQVRIACSRRIALPRVAVSGTLVFCPGNSYPVRSARFCRPIGRSWFLARRPLEFLHVHQQKICLRCQWTPLFFARPSCKCHPVARRLQVHTRITSAVQGTPIRDLDYRLAARKDQCNARSIVPVLRAKRTPAHSLSAFPSETASTRYGAEDRLTRQRRIPPREIAGHNRTGSSCLLELLAWQ